MIIVNQCKGWGCGITPYCERARYIPESERDRCYVREFIPTSPGENCPDFETRRMPRWGDGAVAED
jgi:hypothetical protein